MIMTAKYWTDRASNLRFRNQLYIDGRFVAAQSGERFDCINPATGTILTSVARGQSRDVDIAVQAARKAFEDGRWAKQSPADRKRVLCKLAQLIRMNTEELALLDSLDMGKRIVDASTIDAPGSADVFQWYGEALDKMYDEVAPTGPGDLALVQREALGVVGVVIPWNFPLAMAAWKCAPALASGNSVVVKPAEQSPLSALFLAELAAEAGLPDGVLNVVPGFGEDAGQALGRHMDVDCLAFTGSTPVGMLFQKYAGESNMKQVWLETGGKSPLLILDDADLGMAANMAAGGIFSNQGEICSATSRLVVHASIKEEIVDRLLAKVEEFQPGNPLDPASGMGAMVDKMHADRVMQFVESGKLSSRLVTGGERMTITGSDAYIKPTIFDNVENHHVIAQQEVFGPVLAIIEYSNVNEAIAIANDTPFGLAASLWTRDLSRAIRIAGELRAGTVSVNMVDALNVVTPFGGFKQSGNGRDLSLHSFDKYTALKTTWIKY